MFKTTALLLCAASICLAATQGESIPLWANGAHGSEALRDKKEVIAPPSGPHDSIKVSSIHNPSLQAARTGFSRSIPKARTSPSG